VTPLSSDVHRSIEFTHRAMSGLDVALVLILVAWAFRFFPRDTLSDSERRYPGCF